VLYFLKKLVALSRKPSRMPSSALSRAVSALDVLGAPSFSKELRAMAQKLYVGNLPFSATEDQQRELFGQHGTVQSAKIIMDRESGQPRGFGFVEMDDADAAIQALDRKPFGGRDLTVNIAKPRSGGGGERW